MKHVLWTEWSTWNVEKRGHRWKKRYIGQILFCTHITLWCSKFETKTSSKNGNNIVMHFIHSFFKCSHFCAIISICMINFKLIWLQAEKSAACAKYAKPMQGVDYKNGGKNNKNRTSEVWNFPGIWREFMGPFLSRNWPYFGVYILKDFCSQASVLPPNTNVNEMIEQSFYLPNVWRTPFSLSIINDVSNNKKYGKVLLHIVFLSSSVCKCCIMIKSYYHISAI